MKLTELEPRWIHHNVFAFLCPCCRAWFITCKNIQMSHKEQRELFEREFGDDWNERVIPSAPDCSWSISGERPVGPNAAFVGNLTVTPSLDASAAGHWHGHITDGEIVGGVQLR